MARKHICDNCGKEFDDWGALTALLWRWKDVEEVFIGDYCKACAAKIEARIKEGIN